MKKVFPVPYMSIVPLTVFSRLYDLQLSATMPNACNILRGLISIPLSSLCLLMKHHVTVAPQIGVMDGQKRVSVLQEGHFVSVVNGICYKCFQFTRVSYLLPGTPFCLHCPWMESSV